MMHGITRDWLYKHWSHVSFFLAIFITIPFLVFFKQIDLVLLLVWLQTPIYMLHQFEEHGTGTFGKWFNNEILKSGGKQIFTDVHIFWINVPLTWILFPLFSILSGIDLSYGIWITILSIGNGLLHVFATIIQRKYNPGFFASLVLNIPVGSYILYLLNQKGLLNPLNVATGVMITILLHGLGQALGQSLKRRLVY